MRNVLLSALIARSQQRCDRENDGHISALEWQSLVATTYSDLYTLVAESGMRYYETEATIAATGAASYAVPADHLATIGIDFQTSSAGARRPLDEVMVQEREWLGLVGEAEAFALAGQFIVLYPKPSTGTYLHLYIPQAPDLNTIATSAIVDVVTPDGEELIIWGTAVKALAKSESDVSLAIRERNEARARVAEWATLRAFNNPRRRIVRDDGDLDLDARVWRRGF